MTVQKLQQAARVREQNDFSARLEKMPSSIDRVSGALALRGRLLPLFSSAPLSPAQTEAILASSVDAWRVLLVGEASALLLADTLRRRFLFDQLHEDIKDLIRIRTYAEMQRVMAAGLALRDIDQAAIRSGIRCTVVKGGVLVAEGKQPPVDLNDIDVLVLPSESRALWDLLVSMGWQADPRGLGADEGGLRYNHYAPLRAPSSGFIIELHESMTYGASSNLAPRISRHRLAGYTSIDRPVGAAYVVALLWHSTVQHPFRRGHLRDLYLIAEELKRLSPRELEAVRREIVTTSRAPELTSMLDQAAAFAAGTPVEDTPELQRHVAKKYLTALGFGGPLAQLPEWTLQSHQPLERLPVRVDFYRNSVLNLLTPPPPGSAFEKRTRRARYLLYLPAWLARVLYRGSMLAGVVGLGWAIRWAVRRAVRQSASCAEPVERAT